MFGSLIAITFNVWYKAYKYAKLLMEDSALAPNVTFESTRLLFNPMNVASDFTPRQSKIASALQMHYLYKGQKVRN